MRANFLVMLSFIENLLIFYSLRGSSKYKIYCKRAYLLVLEVNS